MAHNGHVYLYSCTLKLKGWKNKEEAQISLFLEHWQHNHHVKNEQLHLKRSHLKPQIISFHLMPLNAHAYVNLKVIYFITSFKFHLMPMLIICCHLHKNIFPTTMGPPFWYVFSDHGTFHKSTVKFRLIISYGNSLIKSIAIKIFKT